MRRANSGPLPRSLPVVAVLVLAAALAGCRPPLDGAWQGEARCNATTLPLSALLDEEPDLEVEGVIYIENFFGFIVRGDIFDARIDADDGTFEGLLDTDSNGAANISFTYALDPEDADAMEGDAEVLNADGGVADTCPTELARLGVD